MIHTEKIESAELQLVSRLEGSVGKILIGKHDD